MKFVLPAVAFIFAIAMSFASVHRSEVQQDEFIQLTSPNVCQDVQAGCTNNPTDNATCRVDSEEFGGVYTVFEQSNPAGTMCSLELKHVTEEPIIID